MYRRNKMLEYICKPAVMVALIGVAVFLLLVYRLLGLVAVIGLGIYAAFLYAALLLFNVTLTLPGFVALVLSMLGDVFLMLPRDLFVAGLTSFLLAHLAYVVGFRVHGGSAGAWAVAALGVLAVDAVVGRPVLAAVRRRHPALMIPVVAYMLVISAMVSAALATAVALAVAGSFLFFASDTLIAWNRFVRSQPWMPLAIIVTYHLGQAGLVLSLAR